MVLCGLVGSEEALTGRRTLARKVLVLGDGACGKTSLLFVLIKHEFPQTYEPTVFENYVHTMQPPRARHPVEMTLWDTAGQEEFDKLRTLSYADTHVVVLCFSADNPVSLENVESRWVPEIRDHCPGVKIVLVALKCDLRDGGASEKRPCLSYDEGVRVAKRINASRYLECSAKLNRGVSQAFLEIATVAAQASPRGNNHSNSSCTIA